jgi:glycosyltransferase involved in cell wall biosynthesis
MMKVLFVDQSGQCGGAELMLVDLLRGLREEVKARVVLFDKGPFADLLRKEGFAVEVLPLKLRTTKAAGRLTRLLDLPLLGLLALKLARRARGCDLIYANTPKAMVAGALAARLSGKRLVFHLHDILDTTHFSPANVRLLVKLANKQAAAVIANSRATERAFVKAGGQAGLTSVVYNGFDLAGRPAPDREAARREWGWTDEQPVAVIAGRIAEWKGQHVLIEALRQAPGWRACIVGDALFTEGDQDYKKRLEGMARDPVLAGRVEFVGFVEDPARFYAAADAVVHCSTAPEPFGRVIVEGMLAGRPVIATNHGGATEILQSGVTGWLVPPGDAGALAGTLAQLRNDKQAAERIAMAGKEDARKRFELGNITKEILGVLSKVGSGQ